MARAAWLGDGRSLDPVNIAARTTAYRVSSAAVSSALAGETSSAEHGVRRSSPLSSSKCPIDRSGGEYTCRVTAPRR